MISEEKALEILGEEKVNEYRAIHKTEGAWHGYVSLPVVKRRLNVELNGIMRREALVLIHPGFTMYSQDVLDIAKSRRREYGDYEVEYFDLLMKRIEQARSKGEKIIAFAPQSKVKEIIALIGTNDAILVPTRETSGKIDSNILGVNDWEFYEFLRKMGIEEVESDGEWKGGCYSTVNRCLEAAGIVVSQRIHFPVRGSYDGLFFMTEKEDREYQDFINRVNRWKKDVYKQNISKLKVEDGSCEATILKEVIENVGSQFMHPWMIYYKCHNWNKNVIEKALQKIEHNGFVRVGLAKDFLRGQTLQLYGEINKRIQQALGYETDQVIIPLIECELLNE